MAENRIGLADIAREAKVHITTVSLALRDSPRLPATTKSRIQELARKLGYQPDPMLSALTAYRHNAKIKKAQGTLAWIAESRAIKFELYHQGALQRCEELGYKLDRFALREMRPARLSKVLRARNIQGLLFAPQARNRAHLNLAWEEFSAVTFGFTLARPQLHVVTNAQYRSARMGMRALRSCGYRRIGFISTHNTEERTDQNFSSGYMVEQARLKKCDRIPMLIFKDNSREEQLRDLSAWHRKYQPDAILDHYNQVPFYMRELGISYDQCGLATLVRANDETELAGVNQNDLVIGRTAVDFVVGMIHRNERGIPEIPFRLLVQGTWFDGKSIKKSFRK
ncbi:MAG: LacI family DNA-binding transcriptional regulator [Verrucomicrobiota bacterium]